MDENIQRELAREIAAGSVSFNGTREEAETIMFQVCERTFASTKRKIGLERLGGGMRMWRDQSMGRISHIRYDKDQRSRLINTGTGS